MTTTYTIPYLEPLTVYAGDTFTWTRDLSSYGITPTDWTLTYSLIPQTAGNQPISITASDNGDGTFLVNVLPATTADYEPDDYKWAAIVTNNTSGERQTLFVGDMKIYVNYATAVQQDLRSQAKQILDALEALFIKITTKQKYVNKITHKRDRMHQQSVSVLETIVVVVINFLGVKDE